MYAVLYRNRGNDDTEELYVGARRNCYIYLQGWIDALLAHTSYHRSDEKGNEIMTFYSPLVSEDTINVWIEERPEGEVYDA